MRCEKIESDNYFYRCKNILLSPITSYGGMGRFVHVYREDSSDSDRSGILRFRCDVRGVKQKRVFTLKNS